MEVHGVDSEISLGHACITHCLHTWKHNHQWGSRVTKVTWPWIVQVEEGHLCEGRIKCAWGCTETSSPRVRVSTTGI